MGKGGGKSSARGGGGGTTKTSYEAKSTKITEDDWYDWQLDPEPFQDALNGEMPKYNGEGKRLTTAEAEHMYDVAHQMQADGMKTLNKDVTTVYRGESYSSKTAAEAKYKPGSTITTNKLTSVTTDKTVAQEYADVGAGKAKVLQIVTNAGGTRGLKIPQSSEIVSPKGLDYRVTSTSWDAKTSTLKVYLFRMEGSGGRGRRR